ncbi:MAG: hypothetical protein L3J08_09435 [Flavobacteriaceae bacterium]|nr:hypothetical protein [Flavobacteriaceae bacterium]
MKKILYVILCIFLNNNLFGQNFYYSFGNNNPIEWIMRFEIVDSETHSPIRNAKLSIYDNPSGYQIAELATDSYGVAILLVKKIGLFGSGKIEIIAENHNPWQIETYQSQFYKKYSKRIFFPDTEINWTDLNSIPSDRWICDKIKKKKYGTSKSNNSRYNYGPGIFEYNIVLERVRGFNRRNQYNQNDNYQNQQTHNESFTLSKGQSKTYQLTNTNEFELEFIAKNKFIGSKGEDYVSLDLVSGTNKVTLLMLRTPGGSNKQWRKIWIEDYSRYGVLDNIKEGQRFRMKILYEKIDSRTSNIKYWLNGSYEGSKKVPFSFDSFQIVFSEKVGQSFSFSEVSIQ